MTDLLRAACAARRGAAAAALALWAALAAAAPLRAQDPPARRLSSIVGVAVEEYGKAFDPSGRLVAELEYQEAVDFLGDARGVAARLSGDRAGATRALLDTLAAAVAAKRPPAFVEAVHARLAAALGPDGALELPTRPIDLAAGRFLYAANCASCHGATGRGDGPAASAFPNAPPAIGTAEAMADVTPALAYRIVSVGVAGTPMPGWSGRLTPDQRWDVVAYVTTLRAAPAALPQGTGLFLQRCAGCHGATGAGDGPLAPALTTLPPEVGSFSWQAERSDQQIADVIRRGVVGSAMPAARDLSDADVVGLVAHVRSLAARPEAVPTAVAAGASGRPDPAASAREVLARLDGALAAARAGRAADAGDRAFDAYIAFEPLETAARAKRPALVATMERHFADFKGAARAGDLRTAERARDAVAAGLPTVLELARPTASGWAAFFQSFLIILREGFEAILVVGAVVAFLIKTGHRERLRAVWVGVGLALVASGATAVVLATVLRALPASREVLEGATMLVAAAVLFSISYWLISRAEAARWQQFIRERVTDALERGGGRALAVVAFLAVYREGAETALFYQALFQDGAGVAVPLALGVVAGAAALAVIFTLFYRYGLRIPMRPFFTATSALLYVLAFVFTGRGVRELQEGDVLPTSVVGGFPHIEPLGIYPSLEGLLAQLALLVLLIVALAKTFWPSRSVVLPTREPDVASAAALAEMAERLVRVEAELVALRVALESAPGAVAPGGTGSARMAVGNVPEDDPGESTAVGARGARRHAAGVAGAGDAG